MKHGNNRFWSPISWSVGKNTSFFESLFYCVLIFAFAIILWEIFARTDFVMYRLSGGKIVTFSELFSSPLEIIRLFTSWGTYSPNSSLVSHFLASAERVFPGLVLGMIVGFPAGIAAALFPRFVLAVFSATTLLYAVPKIGMYYAFVLWMSDFELPKILISFWVSFVAQFALSFYRSWTLLYARHRIDSAELSLIYKLVDMGASRWHLFRFALVPLALPQMQIAFLLSSVSAWTLLVVTEPIGDVRGLGYLVATSFEAFHVTLFFASIVFLSLSTYATCLIGHIIFSRTLSRFS